MDKLPDLIERYLPSPYAQVVGVALLLCGLIWRLLGRPEDVRNRLSAPWRIALLLMPLAVACVVCIYVAVSQSTPVPKKQGNMRIAVLRATSEQTGSAAALAVTENMVRFLSAIHLDGTVEVTLIQIPREERSLNRVMECQNADALLELRAGVPSQDESILFPSLVVRLPNGRIHTSQLAVITWGSSEPRSFSYSMSQLALEALFRLEPLFPDFAAEALQTDRSPEVGYRSLGAPRSTSAVDVSQKAYRWQPDSRLLTQLHVKQGKHRQVTVPVEVEGPREIRTQSGRTVDLTAPIPSITMTPPDPIGLTYASWVHNLTGEPLSGLIIGLPIMEGLRYIPGSLSVDATPVPEQGPSSPVKPDRAANRRDITVGDLRAGQRVLITESYIYDPLDEPSDIRAQLRLHVSP